MDANRFDGIARVVGTSSDRRDVLKVAIGGALGLVGLSALTDAALAEEVVADARRCKKNNDCPNNKPKCVHKRCVECKNNNGCKNNQTCNNNNKCVNK